MKPGSYFQQRADPPINVGVTRRRARDARENFQQRAFACAVAPDNAERFSGLHFKRYIVERPEGFGLLAVARKRTLDQANDFILQRAVSAVALLMADLVGFAQVFDANRNVTHQTTSANRLSTRWKVYAPPTKNTQPMRIDKVIENHGK